MSDGREIGTNIMILKSMLLSTVALIALYGSEGKEACIISLVVLAMGSIISAAFNSNVSVRRFSNELLMIFISLLIVLVSVSAIMHFNNIIIRDIIAVELVFSVIFFLVLEILCRKWQNSLMR